MTQRILPGSDNEFASLAEDPQLRHEELVDLFGQYIMWMRKWSMDAARRLVTSREAREELGSIMRRPYEAASHLSEEEQEHAFELAQTTVDGFIDELLHILAHQGVDFRLGPRHAIRYRLEMEIVDLDEEEIVHEEVINRNGRKFFADYWGRWLNRHEDK